MGWTSFRPHLSMTPLPFSWPSALPKPGTRTYTLVILRHARHTRGHQEHTAKKPQTEHRRRCPRVAWMRWLVKENEPLADASKSLLIGFSVYLPVPSGRSRILMRPSVTVMMAPCSRVSRILGDDLEKIADLHAQDACSEDERSQHLVNQPHWLQEDRQSRDHALKGYILLCGLFPVSLSHSVYGDLAAEGGPPDVRDAEGSPLFLGRCPCLPRISC